MKFGFAMIVAALLQAAMAPEGIWSEGVAGLEPDNTRMPMKRAATPNIMPTFFAKMAAKVRIASVSSPACANAGRRNARGP